GLQGAPRPEAGALRAEAVLAALRRRRPRPGPVHRRRPRPGTRPGRRRRVPRRPDPPRPVHGLPAGRRLAYVLDVRPRRPDRRPRRLPDLPAGARPAAVPARPAARPLVRADALAAPLVARIRPPNVMTQIEAARKGTVTDEMHYVARREDLDAELIRDEVARGRMVIPA